MLNNWLKNLPIRHKLTLMTMIAVINLIAMGYMAHFFFNTSRVVSIIFNAERLHTLHFQQGIGKYYNYLYSGDTNDLNEGIALIHRANDLAGVFGKTRQLAKEMSRDELTLEYFRVIKDAIENDMDVARLFTGRVLLLLRLGNREILNSFDIATQGANNGERILKLMEQYNTSKEPALLTKIDDAIEEINQNYRDFAQAVQNISNYANRLLVFGIIAITIALALLILLLSRYISQMVTRSVNGIIRNFRYISEGNVSKQVEVTSKDELGQLAGGFNELQENLQVLVNQTRMIAAGDYTVQIAPRSEEDEFSKALIVMIGALAKADHQARRQDWFKTGQNQIGELIRGDQSENELADKVTRFLAEYLEAQAGVFYILGDDGKELLMAGSYAFNKRKSLADRFAIGQGLVGQAAKGRQIISVTDVPEDYTRITSATGDARPRNIIVVPLVHNNQLAGVVELAAIREFSDDHIEFLKSVAGNIAISLISSVSRRQLAELLEKTQQQAEELQTQQEELRVANEELEEQTRVLREREAELQAQQEELRVINEELEENTTSLEVQKREVLEKNTALAHARDELETKAHELEITSKYKSEFLANMSHELRTPLNSLLILSRNLMQNKQGNLTPTQLESIEIIRNSGNDLLNLINEILDLAKIESGKMVINLENIELKQIADNCEKNFRHLADEKKLTFEVVTLPGLPAHIQTDGQRLDQVLRNLVSNALKFTDEGNIRISFGIAPEGFKPLRDDLKNTPLLEISVADTGIGIPADKQRIIFEAFQQADGSTSRKYGGTGLGLSISKEIIKTLGGELRLISEPGKGSVFSIYLPVAVNDINPETETPAPAPAVEENQTLPKLKAVADDCSRKLTDDRDTITPNDRAILVIEDDINFAGILKNECHEKGFRFLYACTGESGLKMAEDYLPDAIILDIRLPGIDGITVLDHIKRNPSLRHIPVHMMSALEQSLDVFRKGAIGFLTKPATPEKLEAAFASIESFVTRKVRELLVIEDDEVLARQIAEIVGKGDVDTRLAHTGAEALALTGEYVFDCVVLDLGLPDMTGFELLEKMKKKMGNTMPPVIIYTGRELTREENNLLKKYAESIIVKGVKSEERLLDETALFLHRVVKNLPGHKQEIIESIYKKDAALSGKKVLIVDDDMRNLYALSIVLDEKGMRITEAENGEVALKILDQQKDIDIVLMDIMMPVMDGLETIRRIRKKQGLSRLPIIALTAKAMKDDYDKCLAAGASDYLSKPLDIERLISLMNVWLYK